MSAKPTWKELVNLDPRLAQLYAEVRAVKDLGGLCFCANRVWYGESVRGIRVRPPL